LSFLDIPLSNNTVRHYHSFLSSVLGVAVKWQLIPSNPCERATLPKKENSPPRYLDEEQAARLLALLDGEDVQYRTMIKMFMFTGMRREELCGLEWKDIDFKTAVIRIARASLYIPHEGIITDTTKNASSTRYIKAPAIAIQLLKDYKRWQAQRRLSMGDRWIDCDRLFTKPDGSPIHPDTIGCWFRDFIKANDLPDISIHSLRHTNATLMINSGIPITTIAARLGHADPTTTTRIYTHAIQSVDAAAKALINTIRREAKDIRDKYIDPPNTTEFAVMFLPFEGLYSEVVNRGMVELLQRDYKVNIAGPSTMAALLNSIQMGFKTLAVRKRSAEVWNLLGSVKKEFETFNSVLVATQTKLDQANKELDKLVGVRSRQISRKLSAVESNETPVSAYFSTIDQYTEGED